MQAGFKEAFADITSHRLSRRDLMRGLAATAAASLPLSQARLSEATTCDFDAPGGVFKVGGKVIGGPKDVWEPYLDTNGDSKTDSFTFSSTPHADTGQYGWDMQVPKGMIMDASVDQPGGGTTYRIMGGDNAQICGDSQVLAATLYTQPGSAWKEEFAGQWSQEFESTDPDDWHPINASGGQDHSPSPTRPSDEPCDLSDWNGITTVVDSGSGRHYDGEVRGLSLDSDERAYFWDISTKKAVWAQGPTTIYTSTATIYCK